MEEKKTKDAEDTRALFLERIELALQRERDRAARARAAAFRKAMEFIDEQLSALNGVF